MTEKIMPPDNEQLKALIATVEQLRADKYADVPAAIVREMLLRHQDAAATETELLRALETIVNDAVKQED